MLGACLAQTAAAQAVAAADTATVGTAVATAGRAYTAALQTQTVLYDGPEYVDYTTPGTRGHQFLGGPEAQTGSVAFRGGNFPDVPLRYDLLLDQLVLLYPGQAVTIALPSDKVTGFALGSRRFVRLLADSANAAAGLPTGFYEVLADGPTQLLARHTKRVQKITVQGNLAQEYQQTDAVYVRSATGTAEVSSLRQLLAQLPPTHQAELQRYARQQHLKFGADSRAASAERVLRYYYTLHP